MFKVGDMFRCTGYYYTTFTRGKLYKAAICPDTGILGLINDNQKVLLIRLGGADFEYVGKVQESRPLSRANDPATSKGRRKVNKYEQAVLDSLYEGQGYTGKEIASLTGHPLNCITPRFAPLRRKGLIAPLYSGGYGHPVVKRDKQIVWVLV